MSGSEGVDEGLQCFTNLLQADKVILLLSLSLLRKNMSEFWLQERGLAPDCTSPVFVWGACPVTLMSSHGFVVACTPVVSGSERLPEESLPESTQLAEGRLSASTWGRCAAVPEQSWVLMAEQTEGKGAVSDAPPRSLPEQLFLLPSPRQLSVWVWLDCHSESPNSPFFNDCRHLILYSQLAAGC